MATTSEQWLLLLSLFQCYTHAAPCSPTQAHQLWLLKYCMALPRTPTHTFFPLYHARKHSNTRTHVQQASTAWVYDENLWPLTLFKGILKPPSLCCCCCKARLRSAKPGRWASSSWPSASPTNHRVFLQRRSIGLVRKTRISIARNCSLKICSTFLLETEQLFFRTKT